MKKLITLSLLTLAAFGLVGCGTTPVDAAAANDRVIAAMSKMTSTDMASFVLSIEAEASVSESFDYIDEGETDEEFTASGSASLELRANDIWGEAEASLHAEVSFTESEPGSSMSMTQTVNGYLKDGYVYADGSQATEIFEISSGDETQVKYFVGNLAEALGISSEVTSISEEVFDMEQLLPFLTDIADTKATEKNGDLTVTYNITIDDIVNLYVDMMEMQGVDLTSYTSSQLDEIMSSLQGEIESMLTLTKLQIVLGISADGYFNKFYVDVDLDITNEATEYDYSAGSYVAYATSEISIAGFVHIDLTDVNKTVAVTFPDDLDDYVEVSNELK